MQFKDGEVLYYNPLKKDSDVADFIAEGAVKASFDTGKMILSGTADPSLGQKANYLFWCPVKFPDGIKIEWEFKPLSDVGLAMMFFSADGRDGKDLFDKSLSERSGEYDQYNDGDIDTFHASYYRRKSPVERLFNVCNLRKSKGFHLVASGGDPIPYYTIVQNPYRIKIIKDKEFVSFSINDLELYNFTDDGKTYGDLLSGGYIGFRQMAPLEAEYCDLKVTKIERV